MPTSSLEFPKLPASRLQRAAQSLQVASRRLSLPAPLFAHLQQVLQDMRWPLSGLSWDHERYVRRQVELSDDVEVVMLCWLPGQSSGMHGHGGSSGLAVVLVGELLETRYHCVEGLYLPTGHAQAIPAGSLLVEEVGAVHVVENVGRRPAVSLHAYLPAYDEERALSALEFKVSEFGLH